jgi:hypothetical protein
MTGPEGVKRPAATDPLEPIQYVCTPSDPGSASASFPDSGASRPGRWAQPIPGVYERPAPDEEADAEAMAVALLGRMVPPEQRIPTLASPDEIASVRATFTVVCPALPEAFTRVFYDESARVLASLAALCGARGVPVGAAMSDMILPFWTSLERAIPMDEEELEQLRESKRNIQASLYPIAAAHRGEELPRLAWEG